MAEDQCWITGGGELAAVTPLDSCKDVALALGKCLPPPGLCIKGNYS